MQTTLGHRHTPKHPHPTHTHPQALRHIHTYRDSQIFGVKLYTHIETGRANNTFGIRRAGHFRYFLIFSIIKILFSISYQVNNIFLHQSYLKSPLPVKQLDKKMQKIIFYY